MAAKRIGVAVLRNTLSGAEARHLDALLGQVEARLAPFADAGLFTLKRVELAAELGASDDNRGYADDRFWEALDPCRRGNRWDHVIGLTGAYLERASFNRENADRTRGVVTVKEWKQFLPPGLDMGDYLTYLILCVASLQCAPLEFKEHTQPEGCLFDVCEDRDQLRRCLAGASVDHCAKRLEQEAGWSKEQVGLLQRTLKSVRRRDVYLLATVRGGDSLPFLAGIGVSLAGSVVAGIVPRAGAMLAGALIAGSLWVALGMLVSRRLIGRRKSRRVSFLLTVALPALLAAGVIIGATVHIPKIETVRIESSAQAGSK
jgi:hypothetical protein